MRAMGVLGIRRIGAVLVAGALLLADALNRIPGYRVQVASNGWPANPAKVTFT